MYDLIIIGGGPAGVTAGIYGMRKELKMLMITKDFLGQAGNASVVENWPGEKSISGMDLMKKFEDHLRHFNPEIAEGEIVKKIEKKNDGFEITTDKRKEKTKTVIIATGRNPRPLKVKGEERLKGRGVSYCVVCDGILFKGKTVVVVGGGNSGLMAALELKDYCEKVYILEVATKLRADEIAIKRAEKADNIEIVSGARLKEIKGEKQVEEIVYEKGEEKRIEVSGVFVEIGSIPATNFLDDLVEFNGRGEVKIDPRDGKTKTEGIFAAGDVTDVRDKQIVVACAEGEKALISAYNYLKKDD